MWPLRNGKEVMSRTVRDMKEGVGEVFTEVAVCDCHLL